MKIAIFCPTVSGRGGMESAIRNLMAGFAALGDDCRLFLLGGSLDMGWLKGVAHTAISSPQEPKLLRLAKYAIQPALELRRWKPDALIAADVTTIRMAAFARRLAGLRKMPIASWVHFPVAKLRMKEHLREADCHLAISDDIADDIRAFLPQSKDRVFTIYNGIEIDSVPMMPRAQSPTFLYVGRLNYDAQKRVNDILQALAQLKGEFRAKIVGEAPKLRPDDKSRLLALADELGLKDRVEWMGWQGEPWQAAGSASALVLSSAHEGFPMILLEAISRGIPAISSDCKSGPAEIIEEGKNGWLYPVGDVDRLAALLQQIIDHLELLPGPETVRETAYRFSAEAIAARARQALQAAIGS
jgi:UDP-D-galactose:(glucosyl)LPS alpha-1,6-D-galactosyltransferase